MTETYTHASGESTEAEVIAVNKFSDGRLTWTTRREIGQHASKPAGQSLVDGYEWRIHTREHNQAASQ